MRNRVAGVGLTLAVLAAAAWARLNVVLPDVATGEFSHGMEYMRAGTGPRTLLWLIGSPLRAAPPNRLVQRLLNLQYRPLLDAGYTVWTVGRRRDMPEGYTISDIADDYAALIEQQFDGRVDAVVGVSFGGMVAQYLAARHPDRLGSLALIASGCRQGEWSREIDRRFAAALRAGDVAEARAISMEYFISESKESPPRVPRVVSETLWHLIGLDGIPPGDLAVEAEAEFDSRPVLSAITSPVLLIAGDKDRFFPHVAIEETAALIKESTLVWHVGQGHLDVAGDSRSALDVRDFLAKSNHG